MSNRNELFQKAIAVIIIIIMTLGDVAIIGINAISYAIDTKMTNSDNVEFCAYFVDEENKQVTSKDCNIDSNNLKMYIDISVKSEGYFNGKIVLYDTSFKFKNDTNEISNNKFVNDITENTIILNQINAGSIAKIEVGIEFLNTDRIKKDCLSKDNYIKLTGIYKNSKQDVEIDGNTMVRINWKSSDELKANIGAKIITNKVYKVNEQNKRIVQILIDSKLKNDIYPIKSSSIKLNIPQGIESIRVNPRATNATNGNQDFNENNYIYNPETNILDIKILNNDVDGYINWLKNKKDSLIITCIYPEEISLTNNEINIQNTIMTYDEKQVDSNCKVTIYKDLNGILTSNIKFDEYEIYKGKLHTNEDRHYNTSTTIDVNYTLMEEVQIEEKEAVFCINEEEKEANIYYVQSKINKAEFDSLFGQDGHITILDQDKNIIANINSQTEVDNANYININYDNNVKSILIKTSKPLIEKSLTIYHKKVISGNNYSRDQINAFTSIKEEVIDGYSEYNIKKIQLINTESKASMELGVNVLSVMEENKNVHITAILETNDESKDLYKNPCIDIVFPVEITNVKILSAKALYRNGLKIKECKKDINENGNTVLHIEFEGEQKKYSSEIMRGLEIHIYADLETNKLIPSKNAEFIMNYTNENNGKNTYKVSKKIGLINKNGLLLYNTLSDYNKENTRTEMIDEEVAKIELDMNSNSKIAKVETALINNYDKEINDDVIIIGRIPVKDEVNTFNSRINNLAVSNKEAQIFYNSDINAKSDDKTWTKESINAKLYKVILNNIDSGEIVKISYEMGIPAKLSYNEKGVLTTNIKYNYNQKDLYSISNIVLETEQAMLKESTEGTQEIIDTGLEVNVVATSGNKELTNQNSIYNGETIKYKVTVKNNTDKDYKDIVIKTAQKNGKIFDLVEIEVFNPVIYDGDGKQLEKYWKETAFSEKEFKNITLNKGETITVEYQVVTEKVEGNETYSNISIISEEYNLTEEFTTGKYLIKDSELKLIFVPAVSEECKWTTESVQQANLDITNITEKDIENVEVRITLSKGLSCEKYEDYIDWNSDIDVEIMKKEVNSLGQTIITIQIKKIVSKQTAEIYLRPYILKIDDKKGNVEFFATATTISNNTYSSNTGIREVTQVKKNIKIEQSAKINENVINENSVVNNGDKVDFYITIKNADQEKAKIDIYDYIQQGINVKNITLVSNDKTITDITDKYSSEGFSYEVNLNPGEEIGILISTIVDTSNMNGKDKIINKIQLTDEDTYAIYTSSIELNVKIEKVDDGKLNIEIVQESNIANNSIVKNSDRVEYIAKIKNIGDFERKVSIYDYLNTAIKDVQVFVDNVDKSKAYLNESDLRIEDYVIKSNSTVNIKVVGTIDLSNYMEDSIANEFIVKSSLGDIKSNILTFEIEKQSQDNENNKDDEDKEQPGDNNENKDEDKYDDEDKDDDSNNNDKVYNYTVSGIAWLDKNKNGTRDENEDLIKDMKVKALNSKTNKVLEISTNTAEDGSYSLELPQGKYIIVFEYDNENYYITTYQADGVAKSKNSDAVSKEMDMGNGKTTVGATDVINLSADKKDIDIGLVFRNKFDLKLEKTVSKITATNNSGTKTKTFDKAELAKIEIAAKDLSSSTVVIEYKIKITNVGDIEGTVNKIVDYMPQDMKFSSDLNKEWYKSGDYLYNESLSSKNIAPGQSKEVKLILTKEMTESNVGLMNNTAEIKAYDNEKEYEDINKNNDKGMADVIISVKTGEAVRFALLTLSLFIIMGVFAYYIMNKYTKVRI